MPIDPTLLRMMADPMRSFIVYSLVGAAKTAKQLPAERGCAPTRLYGHLQQLEKHGLVFVERTRLVSGIREKHYRAAASDLVLKREALPGFVFDQSRVEIARGLGDGRLRAPAPGALMAYRCVLKLSAEQAARLYVRLRKFGSEYETIAKQPAEDGRFYAFAEALYPNELRSDAPAAILRKQRSPRLAAQRGRSP